MRSVTGSWTWPENPLLQLTCVTNPSSSQVAPWRVQHQSRTCPKPHHQKRSPRPRNMRATYWSVNYDKIGQTVLTTCVSWTLTLSTNYQRHQKSVFSRQSGQRRKFIWRNASRNLDIFCRSSPPLMGYWVWRRWLLWKGYPPDLQQNGNNPNIGHADTPILGFSSLWCGPHTGAFRGPGFQNIRSVCSVHSWRTASVPIFSDRRSRKNPNPAQLPPRNTSQIYWAWRTNMTQKLYRYHQQAACWTDLIIQGIGCTIHDIQGWGRVRPPPPRQYKTFTHYNIMYFYMKNKQTY